jgi:hypothetical protein
MPVCLSRTILTTSSKTNLVPAAKSFALPYSIKTAASAKNPDTHRPTAHNTVLAATTAVMNPLVTSSANNLAVTNLVARLLATSSANNLAVTTAVTTAVTSHSTASAKTLTARSVKSECVMRRTSVNKTVVPNRGFRLPW